jgi:hypothetical protein
MMTNPQHFETLVSDHRSSLLREARVHRLRRRTVRAVVRTAAPTVRSGNLAAWPVPAPQPAPAARHLQPV